jgi:hypothetical protein
VVLAGVRDPLDALEVVMESGSTERSFAWMVGKMFTTRPFTKIDCLLVSVEGTSEVPKRYCHRGPFLVTGFGERASRVKRLRPLTKSVKVWVIAGELMGYDFFEPAALAQCKPLF